jgi:hypothetical protein
MCTLSSSIIGGLPWEPVGGRVSECNCFSEHLAMKISDLLVSFDLSTSSQGYDTIHGQGFMLLKINFFNQRSHAGMQKEHVDLDETLVFKDNLLILLIITNLLEE